MAEPPVSAITALPALDTDWEGFLPILLGRFTPGYSGWFDDACGPQFLNNATDSQQDWDQDFDWVTTEHSPFCS